MREKVANKVLFDEELHNRLEAEIPKVGAGRQAAGVARKG